MQIHSINIRKKHWLFFHLFLGFICILILLCVLFAFLKQGKETGIFVVITETNKFNIYQQVYIPQVGNNLNDFTKQFVTIIDEKFHLTKEGQLHPFNGGFITNCTEPICEGPLAPIYCSGPIISSAWYFGVQHQCPGTKLLFEPDKIVKNFKKIVRGQIVKKGDFMQFCEENFINIDYLKPANLTDWQPNPSTFEQITDQKWKKFALSLHQIWPSLTREFIDDVKLKQLFYPVLSVPNRFLVPGGFFKVFFYWDTYWILKGLYFSNLIETAYGVLKNFAHLLNYHGFIPNSGNIQLSRRSQPPFFTQMIADYFTITNNKTFLKEFLPLIEKELNWWKQNRSIELNIKGNNYLMFQYKTLTNCPRSENFLEDYQLGIQSGQPQFFWASTASACESGLDFSTRWYNWKNISINKDNNSNKMSRIKISTNKILPLDLNVFMALNYFLMANFSKIIGQNKKSIYYKEIGQNLTNSINKILYDENTGVWYDFDLDEKMLRKKFYPSNIYPLLLLLDNEEKKKKENICEKVINYLYKSGAIEFKGGIPSSLEHNSTEQWDFPNGWAPQQHLFVISLQKCEQNEKAVSIIKRVVNGFLSTTFNGFFNPRKGKPAQMWEKYDVRYGDGRSGFGGEYPPQSGFGWTNGVVFEFIRMFYTNTTKF
ncbi:Trehalase [Meloidogyne graminicola]|uniref:Trehalase n=1 Tax=Meloidogyne graminicola TaxID=189291 RepID=A0A8T0A1C3_9BILA|nr:Trehalase [Meloidogyne graminicola]